MKLLSAEKDWKTKSKKSKELRKLYWIDPNDANTEINNSYAVVAIVLVKKLFLVTFVMVSNTLCFNLIAFESKRIISYYCLAEKLNIHGSTQNLKQKFKKIMEISIALLINRHSVGLCINQYKTLH